MIYSMVEAGCAFSEKMYIDAALKAARFIKTHHWQHDHLLRRWRDNEALYSAGLDEYAFLIRSFISLFEAGLGTEWLELSLKMCHILTEHFKAEDGAFYQVDGNDPTIILRKCQFSDGAEPSGNALHCENLLRLYQMTLETSYLEQAEDILRAVQKYLENYPPGYCYHLINLMRYYDKHAPTIVIALNEQKQFFEELRHVIYSHFIPHKVVVWRKENDENLFSLIPFVKEQVPMGGKTTLYICKQGVCQKPLSELPEMIDALQKL